MAVKAELLNFVDDDDDEELAGYSEKVQKRINKLDTSSTKSAGSAWQSVCEKKRTVAEQLNKRNQENEALINRGEAALVAQIKAKAELALQDARNSYKQAYEEGDTDRLISAQESLNRAQAEYGEAERYENNLASNQAQREQQAEAWHQQQIAQQAAQNVAQQAQPEPQVSPEAEEWAGRNSWFMQEGYEEMTSLAYGTHAALIKRGIQPNSAEYFRQIDSRLRSAFPEYDWQDKGESYSRDAPATASQPSSVVAPSARSNGAKPRKLRLTATQISLAKRLGLTRNSTRGNSLRRPRNV